jgi:hypothetical protein
MTMTYEQWLAEAAKLAELDVAKLAQLKHYQLFGVPDPKNAFDEGFHPRDYAFRLMDMGKTFIDEIGNPYHGKKTHGELRAMLKALPIREPTIHECSTTARAYASCQVDERFQTGDVLVIRDERVVGVADTWPTAITASVGCFHVIKEDVGPIAFAANKDFGDPRLLVGLKLAVAKAEELGFKLSAHSLRYKNELMP